MHRDHLVRDDGAGFDDRDFGEFRFYDLKPVWEGQAPTLKNVIDRIGEEGYRPATPNELAVFDQVSPDLKWEVDIYAIENSNDSDTLHVSFITPEFGSELLGPSAYGKDEAANLDPHLTTRFLVVRKS
jgi:hypothetical protein